MLRWDQPYQAPSQNAIFLSPSTNHLRIRARLTNVRDIGLIVKDLHWSRPSALVDVRLQNENV
jgi:hypothetical protein